MVVMVVVVVAVAVELLPAAIAHKYECVPEE